jgi:hypothetical protein
MVGRAGVAVLASVLAILSAAAWGKERPETSRAFTLGLVQSALRPGLSQADVAERLGSPNIVTRETDGREAWVYDKASSERESSGAGVGLGGAGSNSTGSFWGLLGVAAGGRTEKSRSSQRTLTVVIRFSSAGLVETFTWHDSRF